MGTRTRSRTPFDLSLAVDGYVRGPNGHIRRVVGIEEIATDAVERGVRVYWGQPEESETACCYPWSAVVVLNPCLFDAEGWVLRDMLGHEVGHCVVGASQEKAERWQREHYGDLAE